MWGYAAYLYIEGPAPDEEEGPDDGELEAYAEEAMAAVEREGEDMIASEL